MTAIRRYSVHLVSLDPARGGEIRKTRPCVVVSPDEMNRHIRTVIVAPMTSVKRDYPVRIDVTFQGKDGQVVLDQIRTVDEAICVDLNVAVCGDSQQEVRASLRKAVDLYLETVATLPTAEQDGFLSRRAPWHTRARLATLTWLSALKSIVSATPQPSLVFSHN